MRWMWIGAAALTIACLLKLPAVFVGPAIVALLVQPRGWRAFADPRVWIAGVVPLAITAAWYWRAHIIFERTGLTMGILGAPTKMYPAYVSPGPWPNVYSKWSTVALLADPNFYERMFVRFYHFLLLPVGFVGALLGAVLWKVPGRRPMIVWLISLTVFFFIAGEVNRVHEYLPAPVRGRRGTVLWRGGAAVVRRGLVARTVRRQSIASRPVRRDRRAPRDCGGLLQQCDATLLLAA